MTYESVVITEGIGKGIAVDTVGGLQIQVVKLDFGGDGVAMPVAIATPLPVDSGITTPTIYNIELTLASTEYSQVLPANCRFFEFQCLSNDDIRYAYETGKVATPTVPYMTLKASGYYYSPQISQRSSPSTLYFASPTAGSIIQLVAWS